MYSQNVSILFTFLYIIVHFVSSVPPDTLRQVNVLFRHGDRSPMMSFPTDEHQEDSWPQGFGWLTNIGKLQHYHLGKFLRQHYSGFLNTTYDHRQIKVESSCIPRCLMSAYSNLAGLYPPVGQQVWETNLLWQPIPVETKPGNEDNILYMGKPCPRYDQLFEKEMRSHEVTDEEKKNKAFYDFIDKKTGITRENISSIWSVADTLICERHHNMSAPSWLNETVFKKLRELQSFSFYIKFGTPELARLKGGPLLKRMLVNFQNKIKGTDKTKFFMFSAHDTTVCALLSAMKVFNKRSPPYAATILTELHEKANGSFFIRIYYKNTTQDVNDYMTPPTQLIVPGCDADCPFDKFVQLLQETIPVNWNEECHVSAKKIVHFSHKILIVLLCITGLLVLLMSIMIGLYIRRREARKYETILEEDFQ